MTLTLDLTPQTEAWIAAQAEEFGIEPAEVALRLLEERAATATSLTTLQLNEKSPAAMLLGLFSNPADAALIDEVSAIAAAGRRTVSTRKIGL